MSVTLSQLSDVIYSFGNDVHLLHFHTIGTEFLEYHEILGDLYTICFDMYDAISEQAISHDEFIGNPSGATERANWIPLEYNNENAFTVEDILKFIETKGNEVLKIIEDVKEYESYVQSIVDSYTEDLAVIITYKLKQSSK